MRDRWSLNSTGGDDFRSYMVTRAFHKWWRELGTMNGISAIFALDDASSASATSCVVVGSPGARPRPLGSKMQHTTPILGRISKSNLRSWTTVSA